MFLEDVGPDERQLGEWAFRIPGPWFLAPLDTKQIQATAAEFYSLKDGGILRQVFERFCAIDLHPNQVSNIEMGYLFEDLIRRFSEISNETAGEHFTPREVIRLTERPCGADRHRHYPHSL